MTNKLIDQLSRFEAGSPYSKFDPETGEGLARAEPTEAELAEPMVAPGRPAEYETGIVYRADHETLDDGMCRQARLHARALAAGAVPVSLRTIRNLIRRGDRILTAGDDLLSPSVWEEVGRLRHVQFRKTALAVTHLVITDGSALMRLLVPAYLQNEPKAVADVLSRQVIYTPWERDRVAPDVIEVLNKVGQVWLQCIRNVNAFVESGLSPEKVRMMPNAYDDTSPLCRPPPARRGRRFYNIGKWEPRKDQHALIGAFLRTFGPGKASLYVKTFDYRPWKDYPPAKRSVALWLEDPRVIAKGWTAELAARDCIVDTRRFSEEQIVKLHHLSNIYATASHAEGWDYPAFDAVSAGNSLVHVGFGGSEDFACHAADDERVGWYTGPVHPDYEWGESKWAVYDETELDRALSAVTPPTERHHPDSLRAFNLFNAGGTMRLYLAEVAESVGEAELAQELRRSPS